MKPELKNEHPGSKYFKQATARVKSVETEAMKRNY